MEYLKKKFNVNVVSILVELFEVIIHFVQIKTLIHFKMFI